MLLKALNKLVETVTVVKDGARAVINKTEAGKWALNGWDAVTGDGPEEEEEEEEEEVADPQ
jgi:hypothetical protein